MHTYKMLVYHSIWIYISAHFLIIKCFQFTCQREALGSCGPKPSSKISNHPGHRWCPLPHYILLSCMLRLVYNRKFQLLRIFYFFSYLAVSIFLRLPIAIKSLLLGAMGIVYILLIELSHAPVFECWDKRAVSMVPLHITAAIVIVFVLAVALHGRQVIFCLLFYRINIRRMIRLNGWQDLISYGNFKHVMKSWIWKPCKVQTGMMNVKIWDGQEFT